MALTKVKANNILLTTPAASSNDVTPATTQYVTTALANLADSAPATLNTLNELAAALGDDAAFSTTVTNSIATKLPLAGGTMTGLLTGIGVTTNGARNIIQRANDDSSIAFANNASGTPSSHTWAIGLDYSASNGLAIAYSGSGIPSLTGNNLVQIDTSGNVGIGTNQPAQSLEVVKNGFAYIRTRSTAGSFTGFDIGQHSGGGIYLNNRDNTSITFQTNNTPRVTINNTGSTTFLGRIQPNEHIIFQSATGYIQFPGSSSRAWAMASQGGTAAPGTSSATFGFHHWSGSAWSNPINITASGKLGIGTDNPDTPLHIAGAVSYTHLTLPTTPYV